jgi:hypothetical protein
MRISMVARGMTAVLGGCLVLSGYATTKGVEESAEAQGTYADAPKALLTGKTEGVAPLLQRMRPVTEAMIADPPPGSWLSWRRNPQAWGYSPLKQIKGHGEETATRLVLGHDRPAHGVAATRARRRDVPEPVLEHRPGTGRERGLVRLAGGHRRGAGLRRRRRSLVNAFDARTGEILWRTRLAVSAQGYPVSYEVNGRQYLAVPAGVALAIPTLTPEIRVPTSGSLLSVFAVQE